MTVTTLYIVVIRSNLTYTILYNSFPPLSQVFVYVYVLRILQ
jgi:hypothetical protein